VTGQLFLWCKTQRYLYSETTSIFKYKLICISRIASNANRAAIFDFALEVDFLHGVATNYF
jgi:hypothetical protein